VAIAIVLLRKLEGCITEPAESQVHVQAIVAQESLTSTLLLKPQYEINVVVIFIFCHPNKDQVDKTHSGLKALEVSNNKSELES